MYIYIIIKNKKAFIDYNNLFIYLLILNKI